MASLTTTAAAPIKSNVFCDQFALFASITPDSRRTCADFGQIHLRTPFHSSCRIFGLCRQQNSSFCKPPLETAREASRDGDAHLVVCLSDAKVRIQERDILKKTKQFRAMVSIDDQQEVLRGLFKVAILDP